MLTASPQLCFKSALLNWRHFSMLYLLKKIFGKLFFVGKDMASDIQNCLFSVNICFVAPSQFALYME